MAKAVAFCACGKRNYQSHGDAVRGRRELRQRVRFAKRRPDQQSGRDLEPYWCEVGGLWHLGHQSGKVRRLKRGHHG
jgi:hypothetical protein